MTDQATGERERREPLYTLSTYRRLGSEVAFGHYLVSETLSGDIQVGDPVAIVERHETPTPMQAFDGSVDCR